MLLASVKIAGLPSANSLRTGPFATTRAESRSGRRWRRCGTLKGKPQAIGFAVSHRKAVDSWVGDLEDLPP